MNATTVLTHCAWSATTPRDGGGRPLVSKSNPPELELGWRFDEPRQSFPWLTVYLRSAEREHALTRGLCSIESRFVAFERWQMLLPPEVSPGRYRVQAAFTDRATAPKGAILLHARDLGEIEVVSP